MARPKSEDKRNPILETPTSEISKQAGLAEGALFAYFKTKDDLINALYHQIKLELADAMMSGCPRRRSVRAGCDMWGTAR